MKLYTPILTIALLVGCGKPSPMNHPEYPAVGRYADKASSLDVPLPDVVTPCPNMPRSGYIATVTIADDKTPPIPPIGWSKPIAVNGSLTEQFYAYFAPVRPAHTIWHFRHPVVVEIEINYICNPG